VGTLPYIDFWSHIGGFIFGTQSHTKKKEEKKKLRDLFLLGGFFLFFSRFVRTKYVPGVRALFCLCLSVGFFAGILMMPELSFGAPQASKRQRLMFTTLALIILAYALLFVYFVNGGGKNGCSWCSLLDCVQYLSGMDCNPPHEDA
jgi:hypothetical protein